MKKKNCISADQSCLFPRKCFLPFQTMWKNLSKVFFLYLKSWTSITVLDLEQCGSSAYDISWMQKYCDSLASIIQQFEKNDLVLQSCTSQPFLKLFIENSYLPWFVLRHRIAAMPFWIYSWFYGLLLFQRIYHPSNSLYFNQVSYLRNKKVYNIGLTLPSMETQSFHYPCYVVGTNTGVAFISHVLCITYFCQDSKFRDWNLVLIICLIP